jgi:hypothetical protein
MSSRRSPLRLLLPALAAVLTLAPPTPGRAGEEVTLVPEDELPVACPAPEELKAAAGLCKATAREAIAACDETMREERAGCAGEQRDCQESARIVASVGMSPGPYAKTCGDGWNECIASPQSTHRDCKAAAKAVEADCLGEAKVVADSCKTQSTLRQKGKTLDEINAAVCAIGKKAVKDACSRKVKVAQAACRASYADSTGSCQREMRSCLPGQAMYRDSYGEIGRNADCSGDHRDCVASAGEGQRYCLAEIDTTCEGAVENFTCP